MQRASLIALAIVAACGYEHRGEPRGPELEPQTRELAEGKHLYQVYCYQCHPGGHTGLGPALNDKPLPEAMIRTQIRVGAGAMPPFDQSWLDDHQVDEIAHYVRTLRKQPAVARR
jgi:mono/diheme cytochrome c family protein